MNVSTTPAIEHAEPQPLAPVASNERIVTLDVLRGIALFGVLAGNIGHQFSGMVHVPWEVVEGFFGQLSPHGLAFQFGWMFVDGKARTTFAFLFGLGFAVQMMRAEEKGHPLGPVYVRRLVLLFLFGVLHATLLYWGDILFRYAALGLVLLLFRKQSNRSLLVWAAVLILVLPLAYRGAPLLADLVRGDAAPPAAVMDKGLADGAAADAGDDAAQPPSTLDDFASGDPTRIAAANVQELRDAWTPPLRTFVIQLNLLGIFLIGLLVGRARVFHDPLAHRAKLRRLVVWALPAGLAVTVLLAVLHVGTAFEPPRWFFLVGMPLNTLATMAMAAGYIAAATLLLHRVAWRPWLARFAPVGRMALTNYIMQSVICVPIFYMGGLVTNPRPAISLIIAVAVFAAQMLWSAWWLARFRFGPLEWLWRSLTYRRVQPMRRARPGTPSPGFLVVLVWVAVFPLA